MGVGYDLAVNLGAALSGAALTAAGARATRLGRSRRTRKFWRFLHEPTLFVIGELESATLLNTLDATLARFADDATERERMSAAVVEHVRRQERSRLIGLGDFRALSVLIEAFAAAGLPFRHEIVSAADIGARESTHNLVLIGGTDVNSLTDKLARDMGCQLLAQADEQRRNLVRDNGSLGSAQDYAAGVVTGNGGDAIVDYGVLARGRHPDHAERTVVLLCGAHGLGTLAAATVAADRAFTRTVNSAPAQFEAIVEYVARGTDKPKIRLLWPPRSIARP